MLRNIERFVLAIYDIERSCRGAGGGWLGNQTGQTGGGEMEPWHYVGIGLTARRGHGKTRRGHGRGSAKAERGHQ